MTIQDKIKLYESLELELTHLLENFIYQYEYEYEKINNSENAFIRSFSVSGFWISERNKNELIVDAYENGIQEGDIQYWFNLEKIHLPVSEYVQYEIEQNKIEEKKKDEEKKKQEDINKKRIEEYEKKELIKLYNKYKNEIDLNIM